MSELLVPVKEIEDVQPHENAERLEIAKIGGWQVIVSKGTYKKGDRVVYFPPDVCLTDTWAELLGVAPYLGRLNRVKSIQLRGQPSFGFAASLPEGVDWELEQNVAEYYQATKYVPPAPKSAEATNEHPMIPRYTDIENARHFPTLLPIGTLVDVFEKIHGTCVRLGGVLEQIFHPETGEAMWVTNFYAGCGKGLMRKKPADIETMRNNWYWYPFTLSSVTSLMTRLTKSYKQVIIYGETFGRVQKMTYGIDHLRFVVFDILVDGSYLPWETVRDLCHRDGVETVPYLGQVPYSIDVIHALSVGKSMIPTSTDIREGVVFRPAGDVQHHPKIGRVILKYVSDAYLTGKWGEQEVGEA